MTDRPDDAHEPGPDARPVQKAAPAGWPPGREALATGVPLGDPPLPDLEPLQASRRRERAPRLIRKRKPRSIVARILKWLVLTVLGFVLFSVLWVAIYRILPPPITATMIGDMVGGRSVTKEWRSLSNIDPDMARAAIAAEDSRFCSHSGFDYKAIAAAWARNAQGDKRIRGGSTISQQTAKNVFLWQNGGFFRKGLEAYFTVLIENIWGKRRIMEVYLNVAETGIGTYGVEAGSQRYFKHSAGNMSPREAAQIAAVLPLPKKRAGIAPTGFTRRYANSIAARIGVVRNDGLDFCLK